MSRGIDKQLLLIVGALAVAGLLTIYSAGQTDLVTHAHGLRQLRWLWVLQLVNLAFAAVIATAAYRVSFRLLEWATPWFYFGSLALLSLTLVIGSGHGDAASSKSWLSIGGIGLQPVEFSKLATIMMLARWFSARREPPITLRGLIPPILLTAVPALLVLRQPDLGSAIVFGGIMFGVFFWAAVPARLLVLLASPAVSLLLAWSTGLWSVWMVFLFILLLVWRPFVLEAIAVYVTNSVIGFLALSVWGHLKNYQQDRIISFLDPESPLYRKTTSYQAVESRMAIGSGGWFGSGFTHGPQKRSGFIPAHSTDFVFAVVGEELGFIGVMVMLALFLGLLFTLVRVARNASDPFASMVVFGVASVIFTHVFENVGMTISVMPITGIPLPFFSYGGSFLVAMAAGLGLAFRAAEEGRAASYVES